jgi:heme ABC exporter ATP-binding subunit CcmA
LTNRVDPLVHVVGLRKAFGATLVLDDASFAVAAGEALALLGANGAGKTTLLRILATLVRPTRGTARIAGFDCGREPERVRPLIGLVGHGPLVYEDLTARENLRFWRTLSGARGAAADLDEALAAVALEPYADERVRSFSAGMKRRLSLARVVLARPRVLLLDEPFAGLDPRGQKWLAEHLHAFKAGGGAFVMVTHSFGRQLAVADRIAILAGGRIALDRPRPTLGPDELARLYALHTEEAS